MHTIPHPTIPADDAPLCASCGTINSPDYFLTVVDPTGSRELCAACALGLLIAVDPDRCGPISLVLGVPLAEVTAR
ncbi:hypothetical protein GCM10009609_59240 [Pseudonocardia aurantiaca]|uniref:Uncharacterized protein n=1 Tax=Pseudonocardia aurantiaca TaxID=75290 RepID=A0ABW4FUR8_9PSEU